MFSQIASNDFCKTQIDDPEAPCDYTNFTASTDVTYLATFEPVVINLFFWEIFRDDGTLPPPPVPDPNDP